MAILSSDGKSVTVQKGDTLWDIASAYLGSGTKYQQIASINGIESPYIIYVGQTIKLYASGSSSSSKSKDDTKVTIKAFGLQSNSDNTLFAAWSWSKSHTDHYEVMWYYDTGNNLWFVGSDGTSEHNQSTYSYPSNAIRVKFKVRPISKTHTVNDKETTYWTANWSTEKFYSIDIKPPIKPSAPSVTIENYRLTAELDNLDVNGTSIQFQIVKDNSTVFKTGTAEIKTGHASYSCAVTAGSEYKVRCRTVKDKVYSEWSEYSGNEGTAPAASSGITSLKALSETSVQINWASVKNAKTYKVEYTTKSMYFDVASDVQSTTIDATVASYAIITGLTSGNEYFFRVKAINDDGESAWTEIKSVVVGKKPVAPTTWSSTTTVITGETLTLYWVHNSQDGSSQTYAELEIYTDGVKQEYTIQNTTDEEEKDKTSKYVINTSEYKEGTKIQWRVRTAGITKTYGDWSVQRTVDVYAPPTLELKVTNKGGDILETLEMFPFYVYGIAGPNTQKPIGYALSISANDIYETVDNVGNPVTISAGEQVYSKHFDITDALLVEFSASNINLENNISYTVSCTVSMDSGLTAEASSEFKVSWTDVEYNVNAELSIDPDPVTASIRPYCEVSQTKYYKVQLLDQEYVRTDEEIDISSIDNVYTETGEIVYMGVTAQGLYYCEVCVDIDGNPIAPIYHAVEYHSGAYEIGGVIMDYELIDMTYTTTDERLFLGMDTATGTEILYCAVEERVLVEGITLSVYRREFDGSFTELATGIVNTKQTFITDPHPALDYARYRIVGILDSTGAVSYADLPPFPVGEKAIIIQWDEAWSSFDTSIADSLEQPPWSGSLLRLPYNIDVADNNKSDVSLIEYIGRKRPVSYYGTQLGESATWNTDIDKKDEETLYALRRLSLWMGDAYVREPSGSGYWAHVAVSFSQKHRELVIPVTLNLTRVEGGI